jgi:hypothetical protein
MKFLSIIQAHHLRRYITSTIETLSLKDLRINYCNQSHSALKKIAVLKAQTTTKE